MSPLQSIDVSKADLEITHDSFGYIILLTVCSCLISTVSIKLSPVHSNPVNRDAYLLQAYRDPKSKEAYFSKLRKHTLRSRRYITYQFTHVPPLPTK